MNKVKSSEPPAKLYEHKTAEEKKKDAASKQSEASATGVSTKSNLKKGDSLPLEEKAKNSNSASASNNYNASAADDDKKKRNVTFGKSTTYEVEAGENPDDSGEFQTKGVYNDGSKGSPRPSSTDKKVISEKDLSDGRSEKEKIQEMLEKKQREELEEIQQMNQWKPNNSNNYGNKDNVGDSSSSNPITV